MRQGKSVDIFSFGLVIFYCLTGGKHAFGESYERDFNILQASSSTFLPLGHDLIPSYSICSTPCIIVFFSRFNSPLLFLNYPLLRQTDCLTAIRTASFATRAHGTIFGDLLSRPKMGRQASWVHLASPS